MPTACVRPIANDSLFCESRRIMSEIEDELVAEKALSCEHSELERMLSGRANELVRALLQANLELRATLEREVQVGGADGIERSQVRRGRRALETVFGEVTVERLLYQAPGVEGLAPMDAALN